MADCNPADNKYLGGESKGSTPSPSTNDLVKRFVHEWADKPRKGSPEERDVHIEDSDSLLHEEYDLGFQDGLRAMARHLEFLGIDNYYPYVRDREYHVESMKLYKHSNGDSNDSDSSG